MPLLARQTHDPSSCELQRRAHAPAELTSFNGTVHFAFVASASGVQRELNGCAAVSTTSTTGVSYDAFGNLRTSATTITAGADTFSSSIANTYYPPDTAQWLVGLVQQTAVIKQAPIPAGATANSVTRTTVYSYVPGTTLVATQQVEPSNAALALTTDMSARDRFGNVVARTLRWTAPGASSQSSRTVETVIRMDTRGRWPLTTSNALTQSESKTFDDAYGGVLSDTDVNGLVTTWQYDTFGSKTRQTDPDGTYAAFATRQCSSGCGWARSVGIVRDFAPGGVEIAPPKLAYADALGREVLSQKWGFDGTEVRAEKEYDASRRLLRAARPHYVSDVPVWTTYDGYDALGRNTHYFTPDGGNSIAYSGLTTSYTNPKSQTRSELRNAFGLVKSNTDAAGKTSTYWYDPFGNVLRNIDPLGNTISAAYDTLGRRTNLNDPDLGNWS